MKIGQQKKKKYKAVFYVVVQHQVCLVQKRLYIALRTYCLKKITGFNFVKTFYVSDFYDEWSQIRSSPPSVRPSRPRSVICVIGTSPEGSLQIIYTKQSTRSTHFRKMADCHNAEVEELRFVCASSGFVMISQGNSRK